MKLYTPDKLVETTGDLMLIYGDSGVGKSVTAIQTCPEPILYIMAEGRDVKKMLNAAQKPDVQIQFGFYTTWDDMMETVTDFGFFKPFRSIVVDSLTHLMSIGLADEILTENYNAMDKATINKEMTMRVKMSVEGYGTLSGQMLRFTNALAKLSQGGHAVVCIARSEQSPKFNRALQGAPALKGQEYTKHMQGFFDFIGYVEQNVVDNEHGREVQYPPLVSFVSDGSFMAKWTGMMPGAGVWKRKLNIEKILKAAHGESNGKKTV